MAGKQGEVLIGFQLFPRKDPNLPPSSRLEASLNPPFLAKTQRIMLALEFGASGITVNAYAPGVIDTPIQRPRTLLVWSHSWSPRERGLLLGRAFVVWNLWHPDFLTHSFPSDFNQWGDLFRLRDLLGGQR
ncbi:hypothetical protein B0H13DRAFT_1863801 [Mycena leptocephala]|nr:hypothetical protein B0H13DRAFT_1863801 [Mycena leptocephala]